MSHALKARPVCAVDVATKDRTPSCGAHSRPALLPAAAKRLLYRSSCLSGTSCHTKLWVRARKRASASCPLSARPPPPAGESKPGAADLSAGPVLCCRHPLSLDVTWQGRAMVSNSKGVCGGDVDQCAAGNAGEQGGARAARLQALVLLGFGVLRGVWPCSRDVCTASAGSLAKWRQVTKVVCDEMSCLLRSGTQRGEAKPQLGTHHCCCVRHLLRTAVCLEWLSVALYLLYRD